MRVLGECLVLISYLFKYSSGILIFCTSNGNKKLLQGIEDIEVLSKKGHRLLVGETVVSKKTKAQEIKILP